MEDMRNENKQMCKSIVKWNIFKLLDSRLESGFCQGAQGLPQTVPYSLHGERGCSVMPAAAMFEE